MHISAFETCFFNRNQDSMEEEKEELSPKSLVNFGSSLLVPSVKELAKQHINTEIPSRYIRSDQGSPITSTPHQICLPSVPIIDIHSLLSQESNSSEAAATESELDILHSACRNWGFFQIINHGVSSSLLEKIKLEIKNFFELPVEEKQKLWQQPGDQEGFGQLFVVSEDQKLDWSDMFFIITLPTTIRKPHLFVKLPLPLRETFESYSLEIQKLAMTVLGQMAKALKMDAEEMRQLFDDGFQAMRLNYYPLCSQPEKAIGFTPHSDASALTILLQLNETEGLQIRNEGKWIPVKPLPNAFVVNIGDIMEIVSNGVYRSIEHRAVVNSTKERLSIATFYSTNLDAEIGPACSLIGPHKPALFKRVMTEKYYRDFFAREIKAKSYLDSMRINGTGES